MMNDQIDILYTKGPGAFEFDKNGISTKYEWILSKSREFIDLSCLKIEFNISSNSFDDDSAQIINHLRKDLDFELSIGNKRKYIAKGDPQVLYSDLEFELTYHDNVATLTSCSDILFLNPRGGEWVIDMRVIDTQFHKDITRENFWIGGVTLSVHNKWMALNSNRWWRDKNNNCSEAYTSDIRVLIPMAE